MMHRSTRIRSLAALVVLASLLAGCAAGRAFGRGNSAARAGDWDMAVEHYRRAVQENPNRPDFRIALERAMLSASQQHLEQARLLEARGQLEEALRAYRRASEYDPPNRQLAAQVLQLERRIRDTLEAARRPAQPATPARQAGPPPLINLTEVIPAISFSQASLRDILGFVAMAAAINITYDRDFQDRTYSVQMDEVTLEEALNQILTANTLFYKVINQRTIIVVPDNAQKRAQYDEQVIQTFYVSHADAADLAQLINTILRVPGVQYMVSGNKTSNTITFRGTTNLAAIVERLVVANDKPRAEVVVDVQILEVSRSRAKQFGIELSSYNVNTVFSPETDPRGVQADGSPSATLTPPAINAATLGRSVSSADFYLAIPSAIVRFLESDSQTRIVAKPQLRGAEGQRLTLNLGEEIPVPSTTFSALAQGGAAFQPLTSFTYRPIGVIVEMTPRVTFDGEVVLELLLESSTLGRDINIAGQNLPSFGARRVTTTLRLREGEATLLAGLLSETERKSATGFPGLLRVPVIRQLFSHNDQSVAQTDIIMLLTPRIVRTHELTPQDTSPIYIGTQQNLALGGVPPLLALPADAAPAADDPAALPGVDGLPPPGAPGAGAGGGEPAAAGGQATGTGGQVILSLPTTDLRVGGGPYTVPIAVTGASRLSSLSLTVTYNPAALRVSNVSEGSFMRAGGIPAAFVQQVDASTGRIDITIMRTGDSVGVAGTGPVAALLFDPVAPGPASLTITGSATAPGGVPLDVQFAPVPGATVR